MITVAALAPSLDLTYVVERLELGRIHRPVDVVRCAGGKPLNMARAAARLGADVEVVAVLGGATGRTLRDALAEAGIATAEVPATVETRTCVSIADTEQGTLTEVYEHASPVAPSVWREVVVAVEAAVRRRPGWLSTSGALPRELADGAIAELVAIGHRAGVRVAVDTHGPGLAAAVDVGPDLVKINRDEAAELLGVHPTSELIELTAAVQARSRGLVVITDARLGALATDGEQAWRASLPDVRGAFSVGSGDSFLGALVTALDQGWAWAEGLRLATAAGAANALVPGPGRFERTVVEELRARVRVDQL